MSVTIFCTFQQQDFADLAMGYIGKIPGVTSIRTGPATALPRREAVSSVWAVGTAAQDSPDHAHTVSGAPAPPATLQISCTAPARQRVIAMLVNLHAYEIIATP